MDVLLVMIPLCCVWIGLILFLQRKFKGRFKISDYERVDSFGESKSSINDRSTASDPSYSYMPGNIYYSNSDN